MTVVNREPSSALSIAWKHANDLDQ